MLKVLATADIKNEPGLQLAGVTGLADGIKKSGNKIKADLTLKEALKNMEAGASNEIKVAIGEINKMIE